MKVEQITLVNYDEVDTEGDYDPNGHVNNTVSLEYMDTLIKLTGIACVQVSRVGIQYMKEIDRKIHSVQAGAAQSDDGIRLRFFDQSAVYAAGFISPGCPHGCSPGPGR